MAPESSYTTNFLLEVILISSTDSSTECIGKGTFTQYDSDGTTPYSGSGIVYDGNTITVTTGTNSALESDIAIIMIETLGSVTG